MTSALPRVVVDGPALAPLLDYPSLVSRIDRAFSSDVSCPPRLVIERSGTILLMMAAARLGGIALVKVVTVGEGVRSQVTLLGPDGDEVARLDGETLTARRTAAASARAAALMARRDARTLAVLGAGPQAAAQARAHLACRGLERVVVWARRTDRAEVLARTLEAESGVAAVVADHPSEAVAAADIVTAATRSTEPLVLDACVRPGTHVDLVGGFRPGMREADDALVGRAVLAADCPEALGEAGDLAGPIAAGTVRREDVRLLGDLIAEGFRRGDGDVTVYKSVGFAGLDLVAAELAMERLEAQRER